MSDDDFRSMCNLYGFAPSRALREMLDSVVSQDRLRQRHMCADVVERMGIDGLGTLAIAAVIRKGIE